MPSLTFDMDSGEWDALLQRGNDALAELGKTVFQKCNPPSGAYAFFNHNAHAMTALQDCGRIMARLRVGRSRLTRLAHEEERLMPRDVPPGSGFPPEVQEVLRQSQDATEHMKLDFETLYMFGGILLDQWSLQAISIGDLKSARKCPFRELVDALDDNRGGALSPLWGRTKSDMLWLYYQLRFYRNRFIVHATRPWQRGTTMSVFGDDFDLFTPSPPGWLDDEALNAEIKGLLHLAPDRIRNASDDYWEKARPGRIIEVLFDMIPTFAKADREKIAKLFGQKGGSTPDFKILATRLFRFVAEGTEELVVIASVSPSTINLGKPQRTSEQMRARRRDT